MPNEVISGDFLVAQSDSKLVQINVGLALPRRDYQGQISHAHQIVGSASEGEKHSPLGTVCHAAPFA